MEALLFMINSIVIVVMVFQGLRDDRRAPGAAATSIFRTRDLIHTHKPKKPRREAEPAPADPWDADAGDFAA